MEKRIMEMYNDAWKVYKQYLADHNMGNYNIQMAKLKEKYESKPDVIGLIFWWSARVQGLHDEYRSDK